MAGFHACDHQRSLGRRKGVLRSVARKWKRLRGWGPGSIRSLR